MQEITLKKCSCGHPSCQYWHLVGIGHFYQGTGFTYDEATNIAKLLNDQTKDRVWKDIQERQL